MSASKREQSKSESAGAEISKPVESKPNPTSEKRIWIDYLLILAVLSLIYLPLVVCRFVYSDDVKPDLDTIYYSAGRPLSALAWQLFQEPIVRTDQFAWLRLGSLVGAILLSSILYHVARKTFPNRVARLSLAISISLLPTSLEYIGWATCWLFHYSAWLAICCGYLARCGVESWNTDCRKSVVCLLGSFLLVPIVLAIYQPSLSWYWLVLLLAILHGDVMLKTYRRRLAAMFGLGIAQFAYGFVLFKLYFVFVDVPTQARGALLHEPLLKLYHLLRVQLPTALSQWRLMHHDQLAVTIVICAVATGLMLLGCVAFFRRNAIRFNCPRQQLRFSIAWLFTLTLVVLLTHVHWLVLNDNMELYRVMGSFTAAMTVLTFWSLNQIAMWQTRTKTTEPSANTVSGTVNSGTVNSATADSATAVSERPRPNWWARSLSLTVLFIAIFYCHHNLQRYWIQPRGLAHQFLIDQLSASATAPIKVIYVVQQGERDAIVQDSVAESFYGSYTYQSSPLHLVQLGLVDAGLAKERIPEIVVVSSRSAIPPDTEAIIIDFRSFAESNRD
jgi:hypothetical protein